MIIADDIMTEEIEVIYEDMLIRQVAHLLLRDRVSGFPVIAKDFGLVGVITITDFFRMIGEAPNPMMEGEAFKQRIAEFKDCKVEDVMTREVITIAPETNLDEIVQLLVEHGIHFFPVMKDGRMVGIVSRHDILNAIFAYD